MFVGKKSSCTIMGFEDAHRNTQERSVVVRGIFVKSSVRHFEN